MRTSLKVSIFVILSAVCAFGRARASGYCQQGGQTIQVLGYQSSAATPVQASYTGTGCNVLVLYSNGGGVTATGPSGLVSTSGTAVTWLAGNVFNANGQWTGLTITINSVTYTISTCASATACTLTSSAGTQTTPVTYSMSAATPAAIFSDNAGTPKSNPFAVSATGYWFYYADNGSYANQYSGTAITNTFTNAALPLSDPSNLPNAIRWNATLGTTFAQQCATATAAPNTAIVVDTVAPVATGFTALCPVIFYPGGMIQPASGQMVTFTIQSAGLGTICDISSGGSCVIRGSPVYYPQWWGAKCNGSTPDQAAFNAAGTSIATGSELYVTSNCLLSGTWTISQAINVQCSGWSNGSSNIVVDPSMSTGDDVIHVLGNNTGGISGLIIQNCGINPVSGNPARYGINLDATSMTNGSNAIAFFNLSGNNIGAFGAAAIATTFNPGGGIVDGVFNGKIEDNILKNGVFANNAGDDISIIHNTITGVGPGTYVNLVPGASSFAEDRNSMSMCNGAIHVVYASGGIEAVSNDIQTATGCAAEANGALIDIDCPAASCVGSYIARNAISTNTNSSATNFIRVNYGVNTVLESNQVFLQGMQVAYQITNTSYQTVLRDLHIVGTVGGSYSWAQTLADAGNGTQCDFTQYPSGPHYVGPCPVSLLTPSISPPFNSTAIANEVAGGNVPGISGCSTGTQAGGNQAGTFISGTSGTCTVILTFAVNAPNIWYCTSQNLTHPADMLQEYSSTPNSVTIQGPTTSGDLIAFGCRAF